MQAGHALASIIRSTMIVRPFFPTVLLITVVTALAGCTTIYIHSKAGVETRTTFGIVNVQIPKDSRSVIIDTSGIGLIAGERHMTIGWMNESVVAIRDPSYCQVMFLSASRVEAQAIETLFRETGHDVGRMCFVAKEDK